MRPVDGGTVIVIGASPGIGGELAVQLAPRTSVLVVLARRATGKKGRNEHENQSSDP